MKGNTKEDIEEEKITRKGSRRFRGLFKTIFLTAMLCMLVPLLITTVFTIRTVKDNLQTTANDNLRQLSVEKMNEVDFTIQNRAALTKAVADSPYISEVAAEQYKSGEIDDAANQKL